MMQIVCVVVYGLMMINGGHGQPLDLGFGGVYNDQNAQLYWARRFPSLFVIKSPPTYSDFYPQVNYKKTAVQSNDISNDLNDVDYNTIENEFDESVNNINQIKSKSFDEISYNSIDDAPITPASTTSTTTPSAVDYVSTTTTETPSAVPALMSFNFLLQLQRQINSEIAARRSP